jgi:hypothetical protein
LHIGRCWFALDSRQYDRVDMAMTKKAYWHPGGSFLRGLDPHNPPLWWRRWGKLALFGFLSCIGFGAVLNLFR